MPVNIKNKLLVFLVAVLLLPVVNQYLNVIPNGTLNGYFAQAPNDTFSWKGWWTGTWQEKTNQYLNDHIGFRPYLIRLNNQLSFSLFGKINAVRPTGIKDQYLIQDLHVNSWYGKDFVGVDAINERLKKLKAIQDTLAHLGKSLILVYSPCKAFYYPEHIPDNLKHEAKGPNNYETYVKAGTALGINQIDFNGWFMTLKGKTTELLYTKQGVHWSVYGSVLAADSFLRYTERLRNIKMPAPTWGEVVRTNQPRDSDDDLAKTLNLMWPVAQETFSYPAVRYVSTQTSVKPKIIYIGDSFLENWIRNGFMDHTNTDWQVWSRFSSIFNHCHPSGPGGGDIEGDSWVTAMNNTDCIVIMYTCFNLPNLGDGFIEKAFDHFYPAQSKMETK